MNGNAAVLNNKAEHDLRRSLSTGEYVTERTAWVKAQRESAEIRLRRMTGELITVDDALGIYLPVIRTIERGMRGLSRQLRARDPRVSAKAAAVLDELIEEVFARAVADDTSGD